MSLLYSTCSIYAHITNEEARHRTGQPPVTSVIAKRRFSSHKTTHTSFEQPSIVLQWIGDIRQVNQGGYGSVQLNLTFRPITLVSTYHGYVRRIVPNGVSLWRWLCSLMGALLDDGGYVLPGSCLSDRVCQQYNQGSC